MVVGVLTFNVFCKTSTADRVGGRWYLATRSQVKETRQDMFSQDSQLENFHGHTLIFILITRYSLFQRKEEKLDIATRNTTLYISSTYAENTERPIFSHFFHRESNPFCKQMMKE